MLLSEQQIEENIITSVQTDESDNYVAIAVRLDENGKASHAGLIINYDNQCKLFHYDFGEIELIDTPLNKWYFHKKVNFIKKEEVEWFLARCEIIFEGDHPEFGFFCDGSVYNEQGILINNLENNNYTNCVFFCISVIAGFLAKTEYIVIDDWNQDNMASNWFNSYFLPRKAYRMTQDNLEKLANVVKRIPPDHYFTSAFKDTPPISKSDIEGYFELVNGVLANKHNAIVKEKSDAESVNPAEK